MTTPPLTYASVVSGSTTAAIIIAPKTVSRYKGIPMIAFTDDEIDALAVPFRFSLVGTFCMAVLR